MKIGVALAGVALAAAALVLSAVPRAEASPPGDGPGAWINGSVPPAVIDVLQTTGADGYSPVCKSLPGITMGYWRPWSRDIAFSKRRVCDPIVKYDQGSELTNWTVTAVMTIGHEAAHVRGVHNERKAECFGARFAWRWLKRKGELTWDVSQVRHWVLDDSHRPSAYKLRGTCSL